MKSNRDSLVTQLIRGANETQLPSYCIIGGLTAFLYFLLMYLSIELLQFNYLLGVSIAYVFSVSFHFFANRRFTFGATQGGLAGQLMRYLALLAINYAVTLAVVYGCVDKMGFSPYYSAAFSIVFTVAIGYFVSNFWVFKIGESNSE